MATSPALRVQLGLTCGPPPLLVRPTARGTPGLPLDTGTWCRPPCRPVAARFSPVIGRPPPARRHGARRGLLLPYRTRRSVCRLDERCTQAPSTDDECGGPLVADTTHAAPPPHRPLGAGDAEDSPPSAREPAGSRPHWAVGVWAPRSSTVPGTRGHTQGQGSPRPPTNSLGAASASLVAVPVEIPGRPGKDNGSLYPTQEIACNPCLDRQPGTMVTTTRSRAGTPSPAGARASRCRRRCAAGRSRRRRTTSGWWHHPRPACRRSRTSSRGNATPIATSPSGSAIASGPRSEASAGEPATREEAML